MAGGLGDVRTISDPSPPQVAAERIVLDPKYHDLLAVVKAARNGAVYGTKVRFPHALVYATPIPLVGYCADS